MENASGEHRRRLAERRGEKGALARGVTQEFQETGVTGQLRRLVLVGEWIRDEA